MLHPLDYTSICWGQKIANSYRRRRFSRYLGRRKNSTAGRPLEFKKGDSVESLGLKGNEVFDFPGVNDSLKPRQDIRAVAQSPDGSRKEFLLTVRLDTPVEIDYFRNGGILPTVLRKLM